MIHTDSERTNAGHLQHIAFPEDPSLAGHRNGQDSHVLAECIPSNRRGVTGS